MFALLAARSEWILKNSVASRGGTMAIRGLHTHIVEAIVRRMRKIVSEIAHKTGCLAHQEQCVCLPERRQTTHAGQDSCHVT
jgi:hypothetical protein